MYRKATESANGRGDCGDCGWIESVCSTARPDASVQTL